MPICTHYVGYYLEKLKVASVGEDIEKLKHLCIVGRNIKWWRHCEKQLGSFSKG